MKALRLLGIALAATALCAGFTACSDDDDDNGGSNSLNGTTWKLVSAREYDYGEDEWDDDDAEGGLGCWLTFNSNGTVTSNWYDDDDDDDCFIKYTFDGTTLTLNFSDDDCTIGSFVVDGNTATYTCYWYDYDKEWSNEGEYLEVWTFEKQ
ncbi:MAG: hypothetical protein LUC33_03320 [Prevotellaceae bacterium]|nr:hypothetical protein [Prevotellaceae bacterium]